MAELILKPHVVGLFTAPDKGAPMQSLERVLAISGVGLNGDRYSLGIGSFQKSTIGYHQVSFINSSAFDGTDFTPIESRRNIEIADGDVMQLLDKVFWIGNACFKGIKENPPCERPSNLLAKDASFKTQFEGKGGILAEVLITGIVRLCMPMRVQ